MRDLSKIFRQLVSYLCQSNLTKEKTAAIFSERLTKKSDD